MSFLLRSVVKQYFGDWIAGFENDINFSKSAVTMHGLHLKDDKVGAINEAAGQESPLELRGVSIGSLSLKLVQMDRVQVSASDVLFDFNFTPVQAMLTAYDGGDAAAPGFVHRVRDIRSPGHWDALLSGGAPRVHTEAIPPRFCALHLRPAMRRREAPRTTQCRLCDAKLQTNYSARSGGPLCCSCSGASKRCLLCGDLRVVEDPAAEDAAREVLSRRERGHRRHHWGAPCDAQVIHSAPASARTVEQIALEREGGLGTWLEEAECLSRPSGAAYTAEPNSLACRSGSRVLVHEHTALAAGVSWSSLGPLGNTGVSPWLPADDEEECDDGSAVQETEAVGDDKHESQYPDLVEDWEVVYDGPVRVRAAMSRSSEELRTYSSGDIVCGWQHGDWLELASGCAPGFMMISSGKQALLCRQGRRALNLHFTPEPLEAPDRGDAEPVRDLESMLEPVLEVVVAHDALGKFCECSAECGKPCDCSATCDKGVEYKAEPKEDSFPAGTLRVFADGKRAHISGIYVPVPGAHPNGSPLFKMHAAERYLYVGINGKWVVGGHAEFEKGFACSDGFVHHSAKTPHVLPDKLPHDGWWAYDGRTWVPDGSLLVSQVAGTPCTNPGTSLQQEAHTPIRDNPPIIASSSVISSATLPEPAVLHAKPVQPSQPLAKASQSWRQKLADTLRTLRPNAAGRTRQIA